MEAHHRYYEYGSRTYVFDSVLIVREGGALEAPPDPPAISTIYPRMYLSLIHI